jgi:hypothetical protein
MIVDVSSKEEARMIVPPAFRRQARVIGLNTFSLEQIDEIIETHTHR